LTRSEPRPQQSYRRKRLGATGRQDTSIQIQYRYGVGVWWNLHAAILPGWTGTMQWKIHNQVVPPGDNLRREQTRWICLPNNWGVNLQEIELTHASLSTRGWHEPREMQDTRARPKKILGR
jgi:hypothetical protein